jgi:hypothetical protein
MHARSATATGTTSPHAAARRHRRWYRGSIVRGRRSVGNIVPRRGRGGLWRATRALALAPLGVSLLLASGCGGGARQDANEPAGTFQLKILHASFPAQQAIAHPSRLELQVRNTGTRTIPNVAVTVNSFNYTSDYPELAADKRPIWAIEQGPGPIANPPVQTQEVSQPGGGQTAYVNTWALGALAPGQTQTFAWRVVPVKAGTHTVTYRFAAGLAGKAKAALASGAAAEGHFTVDIAPAPPSTHVDPSTGKVVTGAYQPAPAVP